MSGEQISEMTDAELVEMVGSNIIGTPGGMKAQRAQAEINRRLTQALLDSKESAEKYSQLLSYLTGLLFVVAVAQLIFTSVTLPGFPLWARVVGTLMIAGMILGIAKWMTKQIDLKK